MGTRLPFYVVGGIALIVIAVVLIASFSGGGSANANSGNGGGGNSIFQRHNSNSTSGGGGTNNTGNSTSGGGGTQPNLANVNDDDGWTIVMPDGRSLQGRTTGVDPLLGIERYKDTGIIGSDSYSWTVAPGWVALAFGVVVEDRVNPSRTRTNGVMNITLENQKMDVFIADGARDFQPLANNQAYAIYCARVVQHLTRGWLMSEVIGAPSGWDLTCNNNVTMNGTKVVGLNKQSTKGPMPQVK